MSTLVRSSSTYFKDFLSSNSGAVSGLFRQQAFVNGAFINGISAKNFEVSDPATGEILGTVPDMNREDTLHAIDAAKEALPKWSSLPAVQRGKMLKKFADLMMQNQESLARIMTAECGKPLFECRGEVAYAASFFEFYGEEARRTFGAIIPSHLPDRRLMTIKQPVGVCAFVTPWNFPSAMITRKAAPALAAGCTVVCKPAEDTPYSALALGVLAEQVGIPPGVFNVITCARDSNAVVGKELATNPDVRKISFTGSTAVGKLLAEQATSTVKRVSLELGGNAPFIVFDDADLDAAADGFMVSKFRASGQTCVCANRIFVHEKVYEEFLEKITAKVNAMKIGHGFEDVQQGPLINARGKEKVVANVREATTNGGNIVCGGHSFEGTNFFAPTIVDNLGLDSVLFTQETFGPVAPVWKFSDEQEVINWANDTRAGLAAYFYSRDIGRVMRVSERLEYGMVASNTGVLSAETIPFGGIKESGIGREGGPEGINEYLETKYLCLGGM